MAGSDRSPEVDCRVCSAYADSYLGADGYWPAWLVAGRVARIARVAATVAVRTVLGLIARARAGYVATPAKMPALQMLFNASEQIGFLLNQAGSHPGGEMEHLLASALTNVGFEERPQWRLAGMSLERSDFGLQIIANFDDRSGGRQRDRLAIRQGEVYRSVVKLLAPVRADFACYLVAEPVIPSRPVKRQRSEN